MRSQARGDAGMPRVHHHQERPPRGMRQWRDVPSSTAGTAKPGLPALFSPIVLHFLPACARLRGGRPCGCPHGNGGAPAISPRLFPHPCEAASAWGLPWSTSACAGVLLPMACPTDTPLSDNNNNNSSSHRSSFNTWVESASPRPLGPGGARPPWRTPCLAPPTSPSLKEGTSDVTHKNVPWGCENK